MTKTSKEGFTLIELLVVIAIIGILASVVLVSVGGARSQAKAAKARGDLNQIMMAYEMAYSDGHTGTADTTTGSPIKEGGETYMQSMPAPPSDWGTDYNFYKEDCSASGAEYDDYCITEDSFSSGTFKCVSGSCYCDGGDCND